MSEKNGFRAKKLHFWPENLHLAHKVEIQKTQFPRNPSLPDFLFFCGDWGGIFTFFGINASSGQFIFDFPPFRSAVISDAVFVFSSTRRIQKFVWKCE